MGAIVHYCLYLILLLFLETVVNIVSPILRESSFYELFEAVLELDRGKICFARIVSYITHMLRS